MGLNNGELSSPIKDTLGHREAMEEANKRSQLMEEIDTSYKEFAYRARVNNKEGLRISMNHSEPAIFARVDVWDSKGKKTRQTQPLMRMQRGTGDNEFLAMATTDGKLYEVIEENYTDRDGYALPSRISTVSLPTISVPRLSGFTGGRYPLISKIDEDKEISINHGDTLWGVPRILRTYSK